ncbi:alpha/beta hydrolase [Streptosporangium sp. NBC_01756]|uniref:alpha/beta hydrolase n=1 Tax=Streptosporangium sp. NBC_01756 TaxID=2975950 RepID=UPI002DD86E0B|nr:alpha/beta hydrolase [Streptosporangium sp. NBC_01756]WSC90088.1 alpha/beta hydrolase [Streptosporangium sp. NBC_01756]
MHRSTPNQAIRLPRGVRTILPAPSPVTVHVYRPEPTDRPPAGRLVWAHGGSWQYGSALEWHHVTGTLAARSGWEVISVDYRLAPRHRHPDALQDILTALTWAEKGRAGLPLAVGGDSAGGTLAACAALAARDRGLALDAQVLAYPPFDPDCGSPSFQSDPDAFPQAASLRRAWRAWRGSSGPAAHDENGTRLYSTPFEAVSLVGVAPAVLAVGTADPVRDDVLAYASRLRGDRVPVRLLRLPGVGHGDVLQPGSPLLGRLAQELAALGGPPPAGRRPPASPTSAFPASNHWKESP